MSDHAITTRAATLHDTDAVARLAPQDAGWHVGGTALVAEADGAVVAVIGITSGAVFADPAAPDSAAIRLLRERRYRILRRGGDARQAQTPRRPHPRASG